MPTQTDVRDYHMGHYCAAAVTVSPSTPSTTTMDRLMLRGSYTEHRCTCKVHLGCTRERDACPQQCTVAHAAAPGRAASYSSSAMGPSLVSMGPSSFPANPVHNAITSSSVASSSIKADTR